MSELKGFWGIVMGRNNKAGVLIVSLFAAMTFSKWAVAGTSSDDLTKCLVSSATVEDKKVLVRWVFSTLALHPDTAPLAAVTDAQRAEFNSKTARLFERLVTETCKTQMQTAVRNEGVAALQTSFRQFGEVATRELLSNPKVAAGLSNTASNVDPIKLMTLLP